MNPRPLGYEPTDVRLRCLGSSLVTALTSADLRREVVPGLLHLSRLSLSRCVRFTNRFTEPVLDLWLSELPRARTGALRPVGSPRHRRPPARGAGQNRRFYRPPQLRSVYGLWPAVTVGGSIADHVPSHVCPTRRRSGATEVGLFTECFAPQVVACVLVGELPPPDEVGDQHWDQADSTRSSTASSPSR